MWGGRAAFTEFSASEKLLVTLTQGLCQSSPTFLPQHELAERAGVRMNLIFPCSALTGTEEPEDPSWLIRSWRRPGGFPRQRCPQDGEKPAESPLRAVRPLRAAAGTQRSAGRNGTELTQQLLRENRCGTAQAKRRLPHGTPAPFPSWLSPRVRHFKPSPPARHKPSLHHRFFFPAAGVCRPSPSPTHPALPQFIYF